VVTDDGFILVLIRIINPFIDRQGLRPFLLQHGTASSSDFYLTAPYTSKLTPDNVLINEKGQATTCDPTSVTSPFAFSIAFSLANCGYDVWLGNFRGNSYSYRHIRYSQQDPQYWSFTIDTFSENDLPDMIDYILAVTQQDSLAYVGHSLGTTTMFQLLSEEPSYRSKVETFIALAPIAPMSTDISPMLQLLAPLGRSLRDLDVSIFLLPTSDVVMLRQIFAEYYCRYRVFLPVCLFLENLGVGFGNTDPDITPQAVGHFPDTTSFKVLAHYAQRIDSDMVVYKFNYGRNMNLRLYGQETPPIYNISSIEGVKIVLISGTKDELARPSIVQYLAGLLPEVESNYVIDGYNHIDFCYAKDVSEKVIRWLFYKLPNIYPK